MRTSTWKSRVGAALAAAAMVVGLAPAASLGLEADTTIKVTGIDSGDTAAYYQVIEQDEATGAWKLTDAFKDLDLTQTDKNKKENEDRAKADPELPAKTTLDFILDGIDADEAGLISAKASGSGTSLPEQNDGSFSADVNPGLYLVLVTPSSKSVVYKPIFVSADYDQADSEGKVMTLPLTDDDGNPTAKLSEGVAKKSPLTLDKTAATDDEAPDGVAVGDEVTFTVVTNVVSYTSDFTNPVFKITDTLSTGLELLTGEDITVDVEGVTLKDGDYTVDKSATGFVITFSEDFLHTVKNDPKVTITYKAKVTSEAATQVNEMDNTVKLNFSNKPSDSTGAGELKDKTRHYTFDIDGNVFGGGEPGNDKTKEVEKIAVDANGNVIEAVKNEKVISTDYPGTGDSALSPLAGAKFELYKVTDGTKSAALKFDTNGRYNPEGATDKLTSQADGSITIKGLDEGDYVLKEVSAPAGYSFDPQEHNINIAATYVDDADGNKVLSTYTITIDGNASTYTAKTEQVEQDGTAKSIPIELTRETTDEASKPGLTPDDENNTTTLIVNKKLGVLPSTGGSGIVFYLVAGGAIAGTAGYLMARDRRRQEAAE